VQVTLKGNEITVSGTGFPARERIAVLLSETADGANPVVANRKNTDKNGAFKSDPIVSPFPDPKKIYVTVLSKSGIRITVPVDPASVAPTAAP
jgi:hypothetical protein